MTKLDEILQGLGATNHDLVQILSANLNHKMVQKARLGKKPVPPHTKDLIVRALNEFVLSKNKDATLYKRSEIFGD